MTDDSEWITINEAAEISGYNAEYLRRLIRNEKIDYRMFGFMYQVNKQSLLKYLKEAEKKSDKRYSPKRKS
jgi:excisionase family DNA binding protein